MQEMILSLLSFLAANPVLVAQEKIIPALSSSIKTEIDRDKDGFFDSEDFCPKIPGKNKGCPNIQLFRKNRIHDLVFSIIDEDKFFVKERDEIRIGDLFSSGFLDKISGKIWNESEVLEVTR